jgi:putative ABC transport system substrate-binding protein
MLTLGYDATNTTFDYKYAGWNKNTLDDYATSLAGGAEAVDVIVTVDSLALEAAMAAYDAQAGPYKTPVIMAICGDLSESWHQGKSRGRSNHAKHDIKHRLDLLRAIDSSIGTIAILYNQYDKSASEQKDEAYDLILKVGLSAVVFPASSTFGPVAGDVGAAATAALAAADAMIVMADPLVSRFRCKIVAAASAVCKPVIYPHMDFVIAGGLISYGPNRYTLMDSIPDYVDDALTGTGKKPSQNPTKKWLVISTIACPEIDVPDELLEEADIVFTSDNPPPDNARLL